MPSQRENKVNCGTRIGGRKAIACQGLVDQHSHHSIVLNTQTNTHLLCLQGLSAE